MTASKSYIIDKQYNLLSFNDAAAEFCPDLTVGKKCYECLFGFEYPCPHCSIPRVKHGPKYHFDNERSVGVVVDTIEMTLQDGTECYIRVLSDVGEEVTHPDEFDPMTGLYNRSGFIRYCTRCSKEGDSELIGAIALDITHLAAILQKYGEKVAEKAIRYIARKLEETNGTFAYVGGGRFLGIIRSSKVQGTSALKEFIWTTEKNSPVPNIGLKMGCYKGDLADGTHHALVGYAEVALNSILGNKATNFKILKLNEHKATLDEQAQIDNVIAGIEADEFDIYLQPKCEIDTGALVGAEALVRWIKRDGTVIEPRYFVPLLERADLIGRIDVIVWERAFRTVRQWIDAGIDPLPISVNVSQLDAKNMDVAILLDALARKYDVPTHLIEVEITESAYANDNGEVETMERNLKALGFHVLIDDFGRGHSSLSMLNSCNPDILKLDMGFLKFDQKGIARAEDIIRSVLEMAHQLDMYVIAEGAETKEQIDLLRLLGCEYVQGHYFYKAMPRDEYTELLKGSTATMIPTGFHGSGLSSVQRIADCFLRVAEVNIETGSYRFMRNIPEPAFIRSPRPETIYEYVHRYIEHDMLHEDDITSYKQLIDPHNIKNAALNRNSRQRLAYRIIRDGKWFWCILEIVIPDDYSHEHPWVLFTWREPARDISWREDAEALVKNTHVQLFRYNCKTLECDFANGIDVHTHFEYSPVMNIPRQLEKLINTQMIHPDDAELLIETLNFDNVYSHFQSSDEPLAVIFRLKQDAHWTAMIVEVSRSVDFTLEQPILVSRVRPLKAIQLDQAANALFKAGK